MNFPIFFNETELFTEKKKKGHKEILAVPLVFALWV